jgi:hypothetical protein
MTHLFVASSLRNHQVSLHQLDLNDEPHVGFSLTFKEDIIMPLKLNAGLSRKVGEPNYSSRGATVNIEVELDGGLVKKTDKLKEKIRQLFTLVRSSLAEELDGTPRQEATASTNGTGKPDNRNGSTRPVEKHRPATQFQLRALVALAKDHEVSLADLVRNRFQMDRPEGISVRQASQLIDELKKGGSS